MASRGLIEAYWKTKRAEHHLHELKCAIDEFVNTNAYSISREDDVEKSLHRITVTFNEPHVWIHMIAGDVFDCLRSALDYAVFSLAKARFPYPDWTQFPVIEEETTNAKKRFESQTRGVREEAVAYIESLQPYNRPDGVALPECALWVLNKMCNIGKHRRIPIHSDVTDFYLGDGFHRDVTTFEKFDNRGIISMPLSAKDEVALDPRISSQIFFGDFSEGVQIGIDRIEQIYELVSGVWIPKLSSFCK